MLMRLLILLCFLTGSLESHLNHPGTAWQGGRPTSRPAGTVGCGAWRWDAVPGGGMRCRAAWQQQGQGAPHSHGTGAPPSWSTAAAIGGPCSGGGNPGNLPSLHSTRHSAEEGCALSPHQSTSIRPSEQCARELGCNIRLSSKNKPAIDMSDIPDPFILYIQLTFIY